MIPPSTPHVIYLCRRVGSLRSPQVGLVKRCQKYSNPQIDRQARNLKLMNEYNLFHIKLPISHILVGFYPPAKLRYGTDFEGRTYQLCHHFTWPTSDILHKEQLFSSCFKYTSPSITNDQLLLSIIVPNFSILWYQV